MKRPGANDALKAMRVGDVASTELIWVLTSKCTAHALKMPRSRSNSVAFSSLFFSISPISGWFTVALESLKTLDHLFCPHSVYPTIPVIAPCSLFSPSHRPPPHHSVPDRCHPPEPPQTPSTSSPASHV